MPAEALKVSTTRDGDARFAVQARPRARKSAITGVQQGAILVQLAAPPIDGAANAELVATIARVLGVPKRDVVVVVGAASRSKILEVRGLSANEVRARLELAL